MKGSLVFLAVSIAQIFGSLAARVPGDRPNIIIMFLDDSGYGDFAHNGNPVIETPTLSRLAREGVNFTQFYVTAPACSASRYSLLTGRYPSRSGLGSWVIGPSSKRYIHPREITIAEMLKERGYSTAMFGKWHLGNPNRANRMSNQTLPPAHGFETWLGTNVSHDYSHAKLIHFDGSGNNPLKGYTAIAEGLPSNRQVSQSLVGLYTKAAVEFIEQKKDRPFFLYLAHNQPHLGLFVGDKFKGKSRRGLLGDVMAEIDDSMNQIIKSLEKHGIAKNTLVLFSSDNGPWVVFRDREDTKYGEARMHVGYASPFRDGKGSNWEGGHRVPGIFWWPGKITPCRNLNPVSSLDILPTIANITGSEKPQVKLDGRDISGYLFPSEESNELDFCMAFSGPKNEINAIRIGKWKLHLNLISQLKTDYGFRASEQRPLLFNVEEDISERFDRAKQFPAVVDRLKKRFLKLKLELKESSNYWE